MMNKIVVLLLITTAAICRQRDSIPKYYLGEIEITAGKENKLNIIEITSRNFDMQNAYTPFEALQFSPGIYASTSEKNETNLSIRGFNQRQISVMIDGAPVYIPYDGSFDLNAIQLAGFGKISISKNTTSILYGPNSMGGAINIVSDIPNNSFSAKLNYQNGSSMNLNAILKGMLYGLSYNAAYGFFQSKGFKLPASFSPAPNEDGGIRNNSSYESKIGMIKIRTQILSFINIALSYNQLNNSRDVPVNIYTTSPRYWRYSDWNISLINFMFNSVISPEINLKGNIFYEKYKNILDSFDDATFTTQSKRYAFHSTYDDHSYGINLTSYLTNKFLPLTKIIFLYKRDTHKEQGNYAQPFKKYEAEILTAGVEEEFPIVKNSRVTTGISYDKMNPLFADNSPLRSSCHSFNGNIGFIYSITKGLNFYGNASRKTRFPTLKEFYSELMGSYEPNHNLASEQSYNYEIGSSFILSKFSAGISVFYNNVRNLIQLVSLGNNNRQYQNVNKARFNGTELELKYKMELFNINFNFTYLSSKNVTDNSDLPNRPEFTINLLVDNNYKSGFEWNTEISFISKQYSFDSSTGDLKKLSGYLVFNTRIAQKFYSNYKVYIRVNNITDKYYETEYGFPQRGREYFAGLLAEW